MTYAQAMAATSRQLDVRATMTLVDATEYSLTSAHIMLYTLDEGNGSLPLGTVTSGVYTMELANSSGEWLYGGSLLGAKVLKGAKVELEVGVYHDAAWDWKPAGVFYVDTAAAKESDTRIVLSGYDALVEALDMEFEDTLEYRSTTTLQNVLDHIRSKGVTINGTLACNASAIIAFAPDFGDEPTLRTALSYVAQLGGCFVRCDREGNIELAPTHAGASSRTITPVNYLSMTNDEAYFSFNRIKALPVGAKKEAFVQSYISDTEELATDTLIIDNNPLLKTTKTYNYYLTSHTTPRAGVTYYTRQGSKYTAQENPIEAAMGLYYQRSTTYNTTALQSMVDALKTALTGLAFKQMPFRWRGDPTLEIGDVITLTDTNSASTTFTVVQQKTTYDNGYFADVTCPLDLESGIPSTMTAGGSVSSAHFGVGTIPGSAIESGSIIADSIAAGAVTADSIASKTITADEMAAGTITADEIAAHTITADEIASHTITADEIAAGTITATEIEAGSITSDLLYAGEVEADKIQADNIGAGVITSDLLYAGEIEADKIQAENIAAGEITATHIGTNQIVASAANIANAVISSAMIDSAGIDYAKIKDLVAETAIITDGIGDRLLIARLDVTEANIVSLSVGNLIIEGTDGAMYQLTVDEFGEVSTVLQQISNDDVENLSINAGEKLVVGSITAGCLNVSEIFAADALIGAIKAVNIETHSITLDQIEQGTASYISNLVNGQYISIEFTNGTILDGDNTETVASGKVYKNGKDITGDLPASIFSWERISDDTDGDATWNAAHTGVKTVTLDAEDIDFRAALRLVLDPYPEYSLPTFDGKYFSMDGTDSADFSANGKYLEYDGNLNYTWYDNDLYADYSVAGMQVDVQMSNLETSYISFKRSGMDIYTSGHLNLSGADVTIDTPYFSITNEEEERLFLDEDGNLAVTAGSVSASHFIGDVVNSYGGSNYLTVDGSIQTVIDNLPKHLPFNVTVYVPAGTYNESVEIIGFFGSAITILFDDDVIVYGDWTIKGCTQISMIIDDGVTSLPLLVASGTASAVSVSNTGFFWMYSGVVSGKPRTTSGDGTTYALYLVACRFLIDSCDIQRALYGIHADIGAAGYVTGCTGGITGSTDATTIAILEYGVRAWRGSHIGINSTIPTGGVGDTTTTAATIVGTATPTQSPNAPPDAAPNTNSYDSTDYISMQRIEKRTAIILSEWGSYSLYGYSDWATNKPRQGTVYGSATFYAPPLLEQYKYMNFGAWITPAITNVSSVTEATITITRDIEGGSTGAVTVYIYSHAYTTAPTGHDYSGLADTGLSVSLERGASATIKLDSTTLAALKAGTIKGFGLYSDHSYAQMTDTLTVNVTY